MRRAPAFICFWAISACASAAQGPVKANDLSAASQPQSPTLVRIVQSEAEAADAAKAVEDARKHDESDLAAQWLAARSADTQATIGWVTLLLSTVATALAGFSLRQSTKAAQASNDTLRQIERAWVGFHDVDAQIAEQTRWPDGHIEDGHVFKIEWKNAGNTPALNLKLYHDRSVIGADEEVPSKERPDARSKQMLDLLPGVTALGAHTGFTNTEVEQFRSKTHRLLLYGWAEYFDIFDRKTAHISHVCLELRITQVKDPNGKIHHQFSYSPIGVPPTT